MPELLSIKGKLYKNGKLIDENIICNLSYGPDSQGILSGYGHAKTSMPFDISREFQIINGIQIEIEFSNHIEGQKIFPVDITSDGYEKFQFNFDFPGAIIQK